MSPASVNLPLQQRGRGPIQRPPGRLAADLRPQPIAKAPTAAGSRHSTGQVGSTARAPSNPVTGIMPSRIGRPGLSVSRSEPQVPDRPRQRPPYPQVRRRWQRETQQRLRLEQRPSRPSRRRVRPRAAALPASPIRPTAEAPPLPTAEPARSDEQRDQEEAGSERTRQAEAAEAPALGRSGGCGQRAGHSKHG